MIHVLLVIALLVGDKPPTQGKIEMPDVEQCSAEAQRFLDYARGIEELKMAAAVCQITVVPKQEKS